MQAEKQHVGICRFIANGLLISAEAYFRKELGNVQFA